jgi:hypothetical protein
MAQGPLVVVAKVAASQVANTSAYYPPTKPDSVETIAASYGPGANSATARLFNLSPGGSGFISMAADGHTLATDVRYSLGSSWTPVAAKSTKFTFSDSVSKAALATTTITPPQAPLGMTNVLLGVQSGGGGDGGAFGVRATALVDAPEGGTCHP